MGNGLVHIMSYKAVPLLLQLETRSRGDGCLHAELGNMSGVCQSPMVNGTSLSHKNEEARIIIITPLWRIQPLYPLVLELLEEYPWRISKQLDLVSILLG